MEPKLSCNIIDPIEMCLRMTHMLWRLLWAIAIVMENCNGEYAGKVMMNLLIPGSLLAHLWDTFNKIG